MTEPSASPAHTRLTLSGFDIEIPGTWQRKGGGNVTSEARREREGGSFVETVSGGPPTRETVTLGRSYKPDRDAEIRRWAERNSGRARGTLSEQDLDNAFEPVGRPFVYNVLLTGFTAPETDANDTSGFKNIELMLEIDGEVA